MTFKKSEVEGFFWIEDRHNVKQDKVIRLYYEEDDCNLDTFINRYNNGSTKLCKNQ